MPQYIVYIEIALLFVIGAFFFFRLFSKKSAKQKIQADAKIKSRQLKYLSRIALNVPLSELTRPKNFDDIIGQSQGIMSLKAAMCGPNPQHVIIYGPPGIGKTCAARLVLEYAKQSSDSPFGSSAELVEISAGSLRHDERNIADPLLGSVHDPIYQGAGAYGLAGIPQPKPGAVTKAHGGILFIDEIGELGAYHLQRLLKVLEDRRVFFESSYYNSTDKSIPKYVHDIFKNGMPADFRLVGATTRSPRELPSALRSRCVEVFFRPLYRNEITSIAYSAANKAGYTLDSKASELLGQYACSGRDAVNLVQLSAGIARESGERIINESHMGSILETGKYVRRTQLKLTAEGVGCVNGLAVCSSGSGIIIEIETVAIKDAKSSLKITGLVDEEELGTSTKRYRKKSSAISSVENVLTALKKTYGFNPENYYIHINLPGNTPVDGPSAGAAIAVSVFSAVYKKPVVPKTTLTGEITINGNVRSVGGVSAKVLAAKHAGAKTVIVPAANLEEARSVKDIEIKPASHISDIINMCFFEKPVMVEQEEVISAEGI